MYAAPVIEARILFTLIGRNGNTVEKIRELIAVPPEIEAVLRAYTVRYPEDGASVGRALEFRRRVGEEFERLVKHAPRNWDFVTRPRGKFPAATASSNTADS